MLSYFFPSTNSQATPISTVKAAYDYEASAAGELTITEGEVLQVHERDEEWILVEAKGDKPNSHKVGYVPANYVEEGDGGEEEASSASVPSASAIVIPDSPPRPAYMAPEERTAAVAASSDKSKQDPIEIWPVSLLDKKGKKKKGTLGVGNGAVFFTSESDKVNITPEYLYFFVDMPRYCLSVASPEVAVIRYCGMHLGFKSETNSNRF
ncbi:cytoskeletal protein binding protein [Serendipita sp. 407]|nr:cytoskeletal protein binding protein [Serendipita sp. 407]